MSEFADRVLRFFSQRDIYDSLYWTNDLRFFVNVNDVFAWGTADLEEITSENFISLEQSIAECAALDDVLGEMYGCWLFAARQRKMRPQGASYPESEVLWPLFDAAGPERQTGMGNPYKPGAYKPHRVAAPQPESQWRDGYAAGIAVLSLRATLI